MATPDVAGVTPGKATGPAEPDTAGGARATAADGRRAEVTLTAAGSYPFTARASVRAVARILAGEAPVGTSTPSQAFGANFALSIDGTEVYETGRRHRRAA